MPCLEAGEPFQDGQAVLAISVQIYRLFFPIRLRSDIQLVYSRYFGSAGCGLWNAAFIGGNQGAAIHERLNHCQTSWL